LTAGELAFILNWTRLLPRFEQRTAAKPSVVSGEKFLAKAA
jgi:hypothetical protein